MLWLQDDGGASMRAGWLNAIPGFSIVCGQVLSGALTVVIGHTKYQCMVVLSLGGAFLAGKSPLTILIISTGGTHNSQQWRTPHLQRWSAHPA
jgi:hypothetical protein